jgi:dTDP-4-amino-4,6-dideoxygalactose transaminase
MIPLIDLKAHHEPIQEELEAAIQEVVQSSAFAGGPFVTRFEQEFAQYCGCSHAVGVGSGTEALWLVLVALGIGPGDEVITVPNTFMATAEAISVCGARPVFVDVNEATYTMDPAALEGAITPRTKAIIPVHLYGQMADLDPILEIANRHRLPVIEDACQAHGAEYKGRRAGSLGRAGCFSFYPGKNLGALGEAGAIVTHDVELQRRLRALRDHGQHAKYHHAVVGWNARMDGIQANLLRVKLRNLERGNAARRSHALMYGRRLEGKGHVAVPHAADYGRHVYHLYVVRVKNRDRVLQGMAERGIQCGVHYPVPLHRQPAYQGLELGAGAFPVAERCADEILSLPMYPELSPDQIETVAGELLAVLESMKAHACCL